MHLVKQRSAILYGPRDTTAEMGAVALTSCALKCERGERGGVSSATMNAPVASSRRQALAGEKTRISAQAWAGEVSIWKLDE